MIQVGAALLMPAFKMTVVVMRCDAGKAALPGLQSAPEVQVRQGLRAAAQGVESASRCSRRVTFTCVLGSNRQRGPCHCIRAGRSALCHCHTAPHGCTQLQCRTAAGAHSTAAFPSAHSLHLAILLHFFNFPSSLSARQLSDFFEKIEGAKAALAVSDYSISQTTLEQVFISFVNQA